MIEGWGGAEERERESELWSESERGREGARGKAGEQEETGVRNDEEQGER